ncbi:MAG: phosphotransferase family protein [Myxococcota bacterium]|nr:phosphotransferase family protein [Myxococcota bacterium]
MSGDTRPGETGEPWDGLAEFLSREAFPGSIDLRITDTARPTGGASWETFLVTLDLSLAGRRQTRRVAIKRAPATGPLAPYLVSRDVAIFSTLSASDVPVPELLAWTEDPSVFVRPFSVTGFVEGESHDITKVERWPVWQREREALGLEMIDTLAALQRFRWQGTGVEEMLGPRGSADQRAAQLVDRYLDPLLEQARSAGVGVPLWRDMGEWLKRNAPCDREEDLVIVHGDYRFGNLLWQDTRIAAVLDWERATLGPPMQDLGFICMPLSRWKEPEIMAKTIPFDVLAKRYQAATGRTVDIRVVQYYAVLWQFIEGVNGSRGALASGGRVGSGGLLQPNLVARQTLRLMESYEAGRPVL